MAEPPTVLDYVNGSSTVVVAVFAVIQVALAWMDGRERKRAAFNAVWAEWNRLMGLGATWQDEDLVKMADMNALDPDELLLIDWQILSQGASQLGGGVALLSAGAHNFLLGAIRNLKLMLFVCRQVAPNDRPQEVLDELRELDAKTKTAITEATLLLEDALAEAPGYLQTHRITLKAPASMLGRAVIQRLKKPPSVAYWGLTPIRLPTPVIWMW